MTALASQNREVKCAGRGTIIAVSPPALSDDLLDAVRRRDPASPFAEALLLGERVMAGELTFDEAAPALRRLIRRARRIQRGGSR